MHRGTRTAEDVWRDGGAGRRELAGARGTHPGSDWPERGGEDDCLECDSGAYAASGRVEGAGARSVERARAAAAGCLFYRGRGGAAAVDQGCAATGIRGGSAPAIRPRESGRVSGEDEYRE